LAEATVFRTAALNKKGRKSGRFRSDNPRSLGTLSKNIEKTATALMARVVRSRTFAAYRTTASRLLVFVSDHTALSVLMMDLERH
jgi:hypothetical protein